MIRLSQVGKRYGDRDALRGVDLELPRGSLNFLMGPSGAGKSTLLRIIALMERPTQGQVLVGGHNASKLKAKQIPYFRRHVGMVFQDHRLLMDRSVFDNVALPLVVAGLGHQETARRVRAALDKVGLLKKERAVPDTLSGGEQQRVGIARAVVTRPSVLLADEPTGNLDTATSHEVMELFSEIQRAGNTVILKPASTTVLLSPES